MFAGTGNPPAQDLASQVRHELVMLPYYSVFDDLSYSVDNHGVVTLSGDVTQPVVKNDAERSVKHLAGRNAGDQQYPRSAVFDFR